MRLALALQAWLLRLAPRAFRARFGAELLDAAERSLADARRSGGRLGALRVALTHAADLAKTILFLQLESPSMRTTLLLFPLAVLASAGIGWVDTHAEEVQWSVGFLLLGSGLLSVLDPRRAWLWALLLGLSVPAGHLVQRACGGAPPYPLSSFAATFLALVPASLGALLGFGVRRLFRTKPA
jgi:hypothetical protein